MGRHKLIGGGIRRFEDYKKHVFYNYGIAIDQRGTYKGFVLKDCDYYIYIPKIDENGDFSMKWDQCERRHAWTFPEVIKTINEMYKRDPERFNILNKAMKG